MTGTVSHCGPVLLLIRVRFWYPRLMNCTVSSSTSTSAAMALSKKPSQGAKLGWWRRDDHMRTRMAS